MVFRDASVSYLISFMYISVISLGEGSTGCSKNDKCNNRYTFTTISLH